MTLHFSSLHCGHANVLCIVKILSDVAEETTFFILLKSFHACNIINLWVF